MRFTVELRHAVLNYLKHGEDRRWLRDDKFMIADKEVHSKAGEKIPANFMEGWLSVRDEDPQAFEEVIVMQQPSAIVDEIIAAWEVEDLSRRFPCLVIQRDLQSGALSCRELLPPLVAAKKCRAPAACFALHVLTSWVGPGMTPLGAARRHRFQLPLQGSSASV